METPGYNGYSKLTDWFSEPQVVIFTSSKGTRHGLSGIQELKVKSRGGQITVCDPQFDYSWNITLPQQKDYASVTLILLLKQKCSDLFVHELHFKINVLLDNTPSSLLEVRECTLTNYWGGSRTPETLTKWCLFGRWGLYHLSSDVVGTMESCDIHAVTIHSFIFNFIFKLQHYLRGDNRVLERLENPAIEALP